MVTAPFFFVSLEKSSYNQLISSKFSQNDVSRISISVHGMDGVCGERDALSTLFLRPHLSVYSGSASEKRGISNLGRVARDKFERPALNFVLKGLS